MSNLILSPPALCVKIAVLKALLRGLVLLVFSSSSLTAIATTDNTRLRQLYQADQAERADTALKWQDVLEHDRSRAAQVKQMLATGQLKTADDFFHAAAILNHGADIDEFRLANAIAAIGLARFPKDAALMRVYATSWDRMMLAQNRPQWYATQYTQDAQSHLWQLEPVDEQVSERARLKLGLPSLAEMREKVASMNLVKAVPAKGSNTDANKAAKYSATVFAAKDPETISLLLQKSTALAQFWWRLAESGLPVALQAQQKVSLQMGFHALTKDEFLALMAGDKAYPKPQSSSDACFVEGHAIANADTTLTLHLGIDCQVKPGPVLSIKPDKFFDLQLSGLETDLKAGTLRLMSLTEVSK